MDLVQASVSYVLGSNIENLTLTGTSAIDGTGNALNNVLTGNSAANTLAGGAGNDTYVLDSASDTIVELLGEGTDTVQSSATVTLSANVENLMLTEVRRSSARVVNSTTCLRATRARTRWSAVPATIRSTACRQHTGGQGDDLYYVDNAADAIVELAGDGVDSVQTSVAYNLADHVENLTLTGSSGFTLGGNKLDNILIGNTGNNTLNGYGGNDICRAFDELDWDLMRRAIRKHVKDPWARLYIERYG